MSSDSNAQSDLVDIGRHIVARAYRLLDERGAHHAAADAGKLRIGISSMLMALLRDHPAYAVLADAAVTADICTKIVTAFDDEEIDVAMVIDARDHRARLGRHLVADFDIEFAWVKAATLALDPGAPLPLATWPADRHIVLKALSEAGYPYQVMFSGTEYASKFAAVQSGACVTVVPKHAVEPPLVAAEEAHLPKVPPQKMMLAVRGDPASARYRDIVAMLSSLPLAG